MPLTSNLISPSEILIIILYSARTKSYPLTMYCSFSIAFRCSPTKPIEFLSLSSLNSLVVLFPLIIISLLFVNRFVLFFVIEMRKKKRLILTRNVFIYSLHTAYEIEFKRKKGTDRGESKTLMGGNDRSDNQYIM